MKSNPICEPPLRRLLPYSLKAALFPLALLFMCAYAIHAAWNNLFYATPAANIGDALEIFVLFVCVIVSVALIKLQENKDVIVYNIVTIVIPIFTSIGIIILIFARIYRGAGLNDMTALPHAAETTDPWDCLYFSFIAWSTIGYGDIVPSKGARLYAAAEGICGYFCMIAIITCATYLLPSRQHAS